MLKESQVKFCSLSKQHVIYNFFEVKIFIVAAKLKVLGRTLPEVDAWA